MITELNNESIDAVTGGCMFLYMPLAAVYAANEIAKSVSQASETTSE